MFYKRKKVVHLNLKDYNTAKDHKDTTKDTKEPKEELIFRLKFEKNMRKLFGVNTMCMCNKKI